MAARRAFAFETAGFAEGSGPESEALYLRMDERCGRIVILPGREDRVEVVGREVRDHLVLGQVRQAVEAAVIKPLSQEDCDLRRVEACLTFEAPGGTPVEIFHGRLWTTAQSPPRTATASSRHAGRRACCGAGGGPGRGGPFLHRDARLLAARCVPAARSAGVRPGPAAFPRIPTTSLRCGRRSNSRAPETGGLSMPLSATAVRAGGSPNTPSVGPRQVSRRTTPPAIPAPVRTCVRGEAAHRSGLTPHTVVPVMPMRRRASLEAGPAGGARPA